MIDKIKEIVNWTNTNSGFLGLILFIFTILLGWISGLFRYLRKRPKFKIRIIEQSTFGCIIDLNRTYENLPVHKTAFAIYLEVTNIGNAPSSIGKITLGYLLSDLKPKWRTSRNWIHETIAKGDFTVEFHESDLIKVYPFLKQKNGLFDNNTNTFLEIGKSVNGIVYFEESEAYGSFMPRLNNDLKTTDLIIKIKDSFDKTHKKKFTINLVDPDYTLKANPYFGQTQHEYFINKTDMTKDEAQQPTKAIKNGG